MKEQRLTPTQAKHCTQRSSHHVNEKKEVLWVADIFQITTAGREQLQKVAQQSTL